MGDETTLAQVSDLIQQQQAVQPASRAPVNVGMAIAERLANLPDDTEARRREADQAARTRQQEMARRQQAKAVLLAKIGARYRDCTLENFDARLGSQEDTVAKLTAYCQSIETQLSTGRSVLLFGPPGTGKDHLAVAVMKAACDSGASVEWTDGSDFYGAVRDNIEGDKSESAFLKRFTSPDLLVMSDPLPPIGAINSGFQLSMLFRVIDRRYRDLKATVMTLNVANRDEAENRLSPNIVDRLAHGALAIHCNWDSYRRVHPM